MKKLMLILFILIGVNSISQIEYLGEPLEVIRYDYDSIMYDKEDTLVVFLNTDECINFIAEDGIIVHFIKFMPLDKLPIIEEGTKEMVKSDDEYFFEYLDGVYRCMIIQIKNNKYFGLYVERIE